MHGSSPSEAGPYLGRVAKKPVIVLGILLASPGLVIGVLWLIYLAISSPMKTRWETELRLQLTATDAYPELRDTLSPLGVMLGEEDGPWIAIDYRDTHAGMIASKAIARTRDGDLYEASEHFCGLFAAYANLQQTWRAEQAHAPGEPMSFAQYFAEYGPASLSELEAIESAPGSVTQAQLLRELGFSPLD